MPAVDWGYRWVQISILCKEVTGQSSFDPSSKTMKLGAIFAMGLDQFEEEIEKIVVTAIGEGKLEKNLQIIVDGMANLKFDLREYVKNGVKKGVKKLGYLSTQVGTTITLGPLLPQIRCGLYDASLGYLQSWRPEMGALHGTCFKALEKEDAQS